MAADARLRVGILGATGAVGQRFVSLLAGHPLFTVAWLAASPRSVGRPYGGAGGAVRWSLGGDVPAYAAGLVVVACEPAAMPGAVAVFSALDADVAGDVEAAFRDAGVAGACWRRLRGGGAPRQRAAHARTRRRRRAPSRPPSFPAVFSNARNFRMVADVPLVVPPVNGGHLELVRTQASFAASGGFSACARAMRPGRRRRRGRHCAPSLARALTALCLFAPRALAAVVTNANCSTTGLVIALKPIHDKFGIVSATVATLQARRAARARAAIQWRAARNCFHLLLFSLSSSRARSAAAPRRRYPARATRGCRRWTFWTMCCR